MTTQTLTQAAISGQSGSGGTEVQNFCYDEQNRLVWAGNNGTVPGAGSGTCGSTAFQGTLGGNYTTQYSYTHLGQLWQGPINGTGSGQQYLYCNTSQPHQLTSLYPSGTTCSTTSGKTASYTASYDAWGNMTSRVYNGTTGTIAYDKLDHQVRWTGTNSGGTTTGEQWNWYDGSGQRVLRRSYDGSTTTISVYAFGLEEHDYLVTGSTASATNNLYYYTAAGRLIGELTGNTSQTTFLFTDTLGSVVAASNNLSGSGAVLGNQAYGPYGNTRYNKGSVGTQKGFTGQIADPISGLDNYGARYYDPVVGRFVSADSVQGNAQGMDPYAYVGGNPETRTDPTGNYFAPQGNNNGNGPPAPVTIGSTSSPSNPVNQPTWTDWSGTCSAHGYTNMSCASASGGPAVSSVQVVDEATSYAKHTTPTFGQAGSGMKFFLYLYVFNYKAWTAMEGALAQEGQSLRGILALEAQEFMNSVDPAVWNDNPETMTLLMVIGALTRGGGGVDIGAHSPEPGMTDGVGGGGAEGGTEGGEACSFTFTTLVNTDHGQQTIGTLQKGEQVWAYNSKTKQMELQPVLHVWINHDNDLVDLTLTTTTHAPHSSKTTKVNEAIHTNKKHPFLTKEQGFVPVGQLKVGMHVREADGQYGVITGWKLKLGTQTMYNLEVAQDHTFTVGDEQWIVHNACTPDQLNEGADAIKDHYDDAYFSNADWTFKSASGPDQVRNPRYPGDPYTDRYYFTFTDSDGYKLNISGNFDPVSGEWDDSSFHFSSYQPDKDAWGNGGYKRNTN